MEDVFFSIVIPAYNRSAMLEKTIPTVIDQSYKNWELIIVDDASCDNTGEVVASFNNPGIIYIKNEYNIERSASRNKGIDTAVGKYICFLDSDDLWEPYHLQTLYDYLSENKFPQVLLFTGFSWLSPDGECKKVMLPDDCSSNPVQYIIHYQPSPSGTCLEREILKKYRFNPDLKINEDVELFAKVVSEYPLVKVNVHTVTMLIHEGNTKGLTKNYISPQISVFKSLCMTEPTARKISKEFKRTKYRHLRSELIKHYEKSAEFFLMNREIIRFLFFYPFASGNKVRIVSFLYHIPGGVILRKFIAIIKNARK